MNIHEMFTQNSKTNQVNYFNFSFRDLADNKIYIKILNYPIVVRLIKMS